MRESLLGSLALPTSTTADRVNRLLDTVNYTRKSAQFPHLGHPPELVLGGFFAWPFHFEGEGAAYGGRPTTAVARTVLAQAGASGAVVIGGGSHGHAAHPHQIRAPLPQSVPQHFPGRPFEGAHVVAGHADAGEFVEGYANWVGEVPSLVAADRFAGAW